MKVKALFLAAFLAVVPCAAWAVEVTEADLEGTWNTSDGEVWEFDSYNKIMGMGYTHYDVYVSLTENDGITYLYLYWESYNYNLNRSNGYDLYLYEIQSADGSSITLIPFMKIDYYSPTGELTADFLDGEPVVLTRE